MLQCEATLGCVHHFSKRVGEALKDARAEARRRGWVAPYQQTLNP